MSSRWARSRFDTSVPGRCWEGRRRTDGDGVNLRWWLGGSPAHKSAGDAMQYGVPAELRLARFIGALWCWRPPRANCVGEAAAKNF